MKRGHLNRSVDIRYSITAFNMSLLTVNLKLGLPYRNVWINWSLPWDKICSLIFLILFKRICLGVWRLGQWRKKCVVVLCYCQASIETYLVKWDLYAKHTWRVFLYGGWVSELIHSCCVWWLEKQLERSGFCWLGFSNYSCSPLLYYYSWRCFFKILSWSFRWSLTGCIFT